VYNFTNLVHFSTSRHTSPLEVFSKAEALGIIPKSSKKDQEPSRTRAAFELETERRLGTWLTEQINQAVPILTALSDNPTVTLSGVSVNPIVGEKNYPGYQIKTPKETISLFPAPMGGYEYHIIPKFAATDTENQGLSGTTKGSVSIQAAKAFSPILELLNQHPDIPA